MPDPDTDQVPDPDPEKVPDQDRDSDPLPDPATKAEDAGDASTPEADRTTVAPADDVREFGTTRPPARLRLSIADSGPVTLFVAAHPKQAVLTALALAGAALAAGRPAREAAVVGATVLVGQAILGWHNDIVDRERDAVHQTPHKPIAEGRLDSGSAWYALAIAVLLVIPLSISTGVTAGAIYLLSLIVGILGNVALRRGRFSFLPWAVAFGLYPAYLSYGGFGGGAEGVAPQVAMTVLAALLGVGVHVVRAVWGLVADDEDGWTYLPLTLGRRLGATRLLILSSTYTAAVVAGIVIVGTTVGLRQ